MVLSEYHVIVLLEYHEINLSIKIMYLSEYYEIFITFQQIHDFIGFSQYYEISWYSQKYMKIKTKIFLR